MRGNALKRWLLPVATSGLALSISSTGFASDDVQLSNLKEVTTSQLNVEFSRVIVNKRSDQYSVQVTLTNAGSDPLYPPFYFSVNDIHSQLDDTSVTSTDGDSHEGIPFYVVDSEAPLQSGEQLVKRLVFDNPSASRFSFNYRNYREPQFRAIADCSPQSGVVPHTAYFQTRGQNESGSLNYYQWDFDGDGAYDRSDSVPRDYSFIYQTVGTYAATLEVTSDQGETSVDTCQIEVLGAPPTASANVNPSNGAVPLDVQFTCSGQDSDGSIVLYEWDFDGDGAYDYSSDSTGTTLHTYSSQGEYIAECRVTDDDGYTASARTTTTKIFPAPPGAPTVTASSSRSYGVAPLYISFSGSASDDGSIVLYEWDFNGDDVYDYSSPTSAYTTYTYTEGGIYAATLRATDDSGLTSKDTVEVFADVNISLSIASDTLDMSSGASVDVATTISGALNSRVYIRNKAGQTVRTLHDGERDAGSYVDIWDGNNDSGDPLPHGVYYAILDYEFYDGWYSYDITNTSGGTRYNPSRDRFPSSFSPFEGDLLDINFTIPTNRGASEILAFVGLFNTDVRLVTLAERIPFGVGNHTLYWDGLDANGEFAVAPPGDSFLFGIWGYTLPDNAIFVQAAPEISNVRATPTIFSPSATGDEPKSVDIFYDLSQQADVTFTVTNLNTNSVIKTDKSLNVASGADHKLTWDGRTDNSMLADSGNYRVALKAVDSKGNTSITRYVLLKVFH